MILVTGTVTAKPDTIAQMTREALAHVHRSRREPGCISHEVAIDPENPLRLVFLERWEDVAALKAHFRVPASRAFWQLLQDLAADAGAMHLYDASRITL
ncbi:MAG TPA: putative quinol monooxygenase [Rhizomicrobium sp.]|nr:putative quinol monooxygenase [Rhizomicrobium sp.]